MANTLTNLIPDVYAALDVVSRELVGAIPGVNRDARADRLATNQTLRSPVAPVNTTSTYTPSMAIPSAIDQTFTNKQLTLSKNKYAGFSWTGEEEYGMDQGPGVLSMQQDQIAQAFRVLVNEMENDVCDALAAGASRAYGTAGTAPFGSNLGDSAQVRKILDDNGAPASGRSMVIDTAAGANLRTLQQLTKANEAGSTMTLRDGELLNVHGFSIRESAQINNATAGGGGGYLVDDAGGLAAGTTEIPVDTGSGTILAGDIVTIGNHKYVVETALSGSEFFIAAPGLQEAVADNTAVTVNADSSRNLAFSSDALTLATRLPVFPSQGDLAIDSEVITDPRTGISFDLRVYPGDGMVLYRLHALWGWVVNKPEHAAVLLG
tara:strand:+ start:654 stop:1787 length:1134 start_codon:yes stop_codon:yes gene_type:complete